MIRSRQFKEIVKARDGAQLLRLLRETLGLPAAEAEFRAVDGDGSTVRQGRTEALLKEIADGTGDVVTIVDHPLLAFHVAGHDVHLEPDVIAVQARGLFHVGAIKTFAVIDGQADTGKLSAAAREAAVYVQAMRDLFARIGLAPDRVSHDVVLICPKDFSNVPMATLVDVRHQLDILARQLERLTRIDDILAGLPTGLSFDLSRPAAELTTAVSAVPARYAAECLSACEMAYFCRSEAHACGSVAALGRAVQDDLGGMESVDTVLELATGTRTPSPEQAELAERLRYINKIYDEATT